MKIQGREKIITRFGYTLCGGEEYSIREEETDCDFWKARQTEKERKRESDIA